MKRFKDLVERKVKTVSDLDENSKALLVLVFFLILVVVYFLPILTPDVDIEKNREYVNHINRTIEFDEDGFAAYIYPIIYNKENLPVQIRFSFPMLGGEGSDYLTSEYHWERFLANNIIETGRAPLWTPYTFSGYSIISTGGHGLFYKPILPLVFIFQPFWILYAMFIYRALKKQKSKWGFEEWWAWFWVINFIVSGVETFIGTLFAFGIIESHNILTTLLSLWACGFGIPTVTVSIIMAIGTTDYFTEEYNVNKA